MKDYLVRNRLYRDPVRAKISGVCAGLARYWGRETWLIRLAAIGIFLMFPVATAVAYLLAVVLIRSR